MALPTTVGATTDVTIINGFAPPFISSTGNVYQLVHDNIIGASDLKMFKATDPTSSFSEIDGANRPVFAHNNINVYAAIQDGDTIHILVINTAGSEDAYYLAFDMHDGASGDTWQASGAEELIEDPAGGIAKASISIRSDGDVIVLYQGVQDSNMGSDFRRADLARREGGSWTVGISLSGIAKIAEHEEVGAVVRGDATNDRMHCAYFNSTAAELRYSTYLSGNTFGHQDTVVDTAISDNVRQGISFDDGGTDKIRFLYIDSTNDLSTFGFNDADDPGTPTITTAVSDNDVDDATNRKAVIIVDGTTQHAIYINSTDDDLYLASTGAGDDTWGTDTNEKTLANEPSGRAMSAALYDRSGKKIAFIRNNGTNVEYDEIDLAGDQNLSLTGKGIAATATLGAPTFAQDILPTGITAATAFGSPTFAEPISITGIDATAVLGAPTINQGLNVTGIDATAVFGVPALAQFLLPTGIAATTAFGTPTLAFMITPAGIDATATFGVPTIDQFLLPTGIDATAVLGAPTFAQDILPTGIDATAVLGAPTINQGLNVTGIDATAVFGVPDLTQFLLPTSIAATTAFGTPILIFASLELDLTGKGIDSSVVLGTPNLVEVLQPTGIDATAVLGAPTINQGLNVTGIDVTAVLGTPILANIVLPTGIAATGAVGVPIINQGLNVTGIDATAVAGAPTLNQTVTPIGINSTAILGAPNLAEALKPTGIAATGAFGSPILHQGLNVTGIDATATFGSPTLAAFVEPIGIAPITVFGVPTLFITVISEGSLFSELSFVKAQPTKDHKDITVRNRPIPLIRRGV